MTDSTELLPFLQASTVPNPTELGGMTNQELRTRLAQSVTISAKYLAYLAAVWNELEKRGEDLSDLRIGLTAYLPQIAAGRLDAEAVVKFAGQATVLQSLAQLPIEKQREIVRGVPIAVLTVNAAGEYEVARTPAHMLSASQARLVFNNGRIRTPDEQKTTFESARIAAKRRATPGPEGRVRYDPRTDLIRVGNASATVGEILAALDSVQAGGDNEEFTKSVLVKLTETNHRLLKIRAAEAGVSMEVLGYSAIRRHCLI